MQSIKNFWFKLPAKQKRQLVIAAGAAIGVLILWQFLSVEHRDRPEPAEPSSIRLTGEGTERFQMDVLVSRLEDLQRQQEQFESDVRDARRQDTTEQQIQRLREEHEKEVERLERQIEDQRETLMSEQQRLSGATLDETLQMLERARLERPVGDSDQDPSGNSAQVSQRELPQRPQTPSREDLWGDESRFQASAQQGEEEKDVPKASITVIDSEPDEYAAKDDKDDEDLQFLPAGTIISGTLISGLDAPTAQGSSSEPHPALLRVKEESIMPNRFRGDIRECFIILSGFGDLSSERAYLRSETLSCINEDGQAMETSLASFAVGEDGSAGVRGRLVSKEGQLLAQSLKAGALGAFADVFRSSPVPTIQTEASDTTPFQSMLSTDAVQSGAVRGTSDALDRIAQYYLDVADMIFPVIEISAGREVDLIINRGTEIRFDR